MDSLIPSISTHIEIAQRTLCDHTWHDTWPCRPFARLYWVVDGYGIVKNEQSAYELLPHRLTLIPGNISYHHSCPTSMDIYWAHFTAYVWGSFDLFTILGCPGITMRVTEDIVEVRQLWEQLLAAWAQGSFTDLMVADGLLRILLAQVLASIDPAVMHRFTKIERFRSLLTYIDHHLEESLTLKSLAEHVNLHPTYFANLFAQCVGVGPMTFVLQRRMARAQGLLRHSVLPIDAIATSVGYTDPCYFSRIFHRHTGLCPTKYRQQRQADIP